MILITAALRGELRPLFDFFPVRKKIKMSGATLYVSDNLHLLRMGIGPQKSRAALENYIKTNRPDQIINAGLAGSLDASCEVGSVFQIESIVRGFENTKAMIECSKLPFDLPVTRLLTVDQAVTNFDLRKELFQKYQAALVDMEGFAVAEISIETKIPFYCLKIVSDNADENVVLQFMKNYKTLSQKLAGYVHRAVRDW